jgi:hypothetical protein
MTIKLLYPTSKPSLNLSFANGTGLDGRINFTRPSTATYTGADGLIKTAASGLPRFDNNPLTGQQLGLLIEEARTNIEIQSTSLSTWTATNSSLVGQTITAPDGTLSTVQLLREDASTGTHLASHFYNNTYIDWCISFYVKAAGRTRFRISVIDNIVTTRFDLSAKTVNGVTNSGILEELPNGWFRVKSIYGGAYRVGAPPITLEDNSGNSSYTGDNTSGVYIWGVQLEQATGVTFSSSYIPTSGSAVTRAADSASVLNGNIYSKNNFTIITQPFGSAAGVNSLNLIGPIIKQALVYSTDLPQAQINGVAKNQDGFWRWRVIGDSFALPSFTTDGTVTVDWGDGVIETLNNSSHAFTNGGGYHDIGFRLNSGTYFRPFINGNSTYGPRVIAVGPAPASMKLNANLVFTSCTALKSFDATVDTSGGTSFYGAWYNCPNLISFPLINTAAGTNFDYGWTYCSSLTSFPLINTAAAISFYQTWNGCSGLTSFPLINTGTAINFQQTWTSCSSLTSFPPINTAAGTNFYQTWRNCSSLTSFPLINTGSGTSFEEAWRDCSSLTSFPLINTAAGTNFAYAWCGCSRLTSFPLINTAAGTNFAYAWLGCSSLTSFPLINTAAGTNFYAAWYNCFNLTSFPLINTAAGTNFSYAWLGCGSLTLFPLINTAAGTNFDYAWQGCTSLTSFPSLSFASATSFYQAWYGCTGLATFPANRFDTTGTLTAGAFSLAFRTCALTAASIENILTSLVTNGRSNITLDLDGGTNAGASTWTAPALAAYATLISRGWTITRNA